MEAPSAPMMDEAPEREGNADVIPLPTNRFAARMTAAAGFLALRRGEPEGVLWLYEAYGRLVHKTVHRLLGADDAHEDIVQDVFVSLMRRARSLRREEAVASFVRRVAVSRVIDELRRRKVQRRVFAPSDDHDRFEGAQADPETRDLLRRVFVLLEKLKPKDRVAFQLRYVERYSLNEVASACGCSVATATRRLRHARERLRALAAADPELATMMEAL